MPVELRHWRAFAVAAETRHFGHAAETLGVSQPALSQLVQTLEAHLGTALFDRTRRRIELTATGQAVLAEAQAVLAQAERAERIGSAAGRENSRTLAAGYVGSAALHPAFRLLMQAIAGGSSPIALQLDQRPAVQQLRQIGERVLDFGIARTPLPPLEPEIACLVLDRETMVLATADHDGADGQAVSLAEFAAEPFVQYLHQPSGGLRALSESACRAAGFTPKVSYTVPQIATMLCLVGAGLGVALVPETASRLGLPGVAFHPLHDVIATDLVLLYRRSDTAPALRTLLEAARPIADKSSL
ncbi:LysR substrate-binding domain-containing protein [Jiella sp. M17.18]|uniref:LysR substrate-binding domain-containing protein n=1 Tax=Jiella sp. M17.18 TaxID=3234247 RepID=UPI0034E04191